MLETIWFFSTTMTTVGYGDKLPFTFEGKIVTSFAAIMGTSCIPIIVAILGINLTRVIQDEKESH